MIARTHNDVQSTDCCKDRPQVPAQKERPQVPHLGHGNADVLARTAKARQGEQGALKRGGIDLLVMPPKLKGRLPPWRACSVKWLRRLVKRRN
jgi:hypothetical protein